MLIQYCKKVKLESLLCIATLVALAGMIFFANSSQMVGAIWQKVCCLLFHILENEIIFFGSFGYFFFRFWIFKLSLTIGFIIFIWPWKISKFCKCATFVNHQVKVKISINFSRRITCREKKILQSIPVVTVSSFMFFFFYQLKRNVLDQWFKSSFYLLFGIGLSWWGAFFIP